MNDVKGKNVLITGGSGLIGSRLTELLLEKRYEVSHLSRKKNTTSPIKTYQWDPKAGFIEEGAFDNVDYVIHLAGENLAGHRWTESFKKTIVESRVQSSELLKKTIAISPKVKAIACASGIGIYKDENDQWIDESSSPGNSFPATTCIKWEESNSHYNCRTVILRTGLVLSMKGGALPELYKPLRFGIAPYFGNGKFYQSWIHIDDLCRMYINVIENTDFNGIYNAVAPNPVTNFELIKTLQHTSKKLSVRIPVPPIALKLFLGEQSIIVLEGSRVSANKIIKEGFAFNYTDISSALNNIFSK